MTQPSTPSDSTHYVPSYDTTFARVRGKRAVVIPVINEGDRIHSQLRRMQGLRIPQLADTILVDAGSTDGSTEASALQPLGVDTLLVKTGPGRLSAQLQCAYDFCLRNGYDEIVTIDGNNKDDPDAIPEFFAKLTDGYDFVQASRFVPGGIAENTPWLRTVAIRYLHAPLLSTSSGFHWTDTTQGFRGYRASLLRDPRLAIFRDVFQKYELLFYISYAAPKLGYRCIELPTARRYPRDTVPTKIAGLRGYGELMVALGKVCMGQFGPRPT